MSDALIFAFGKDPAPVYNLSPEEALACLGGKGKGLIDMHALSLPVPPGFILSTTVCRSYFAEKFTLTKAVQDLIPSYISGIESVTGKTFGCRTHPLLVSVRSGAPVSMPGMMDTILNLGLNDETLEGLAAQSGDRRFAYDCYRRFIQMYAVVVMGVPDHLFEQYLTIYKSAKAIEQDRDLLETDLAEIVAHYKDIVLDHTGYAFPQDVHHQLLTAIKAVFESWMSARAQVYRRIHGISPDMGTAVVVQAMVFGNAQGESGTGVAFTRDPSTGVAELTGEFLMNAQGEDVVAGIRTPQSLSKAPNSMEALMPHLYADLKALGVKLENHFKDMQDIEFTVEKGRLWILQTRQGKRSAKAALKIAVDMTESGLITEEEALLMVDPSCLTQLLHPTVDMRLAPVSLCKGLPASPGAASGRVVFTAETAVKQAELGLDVILVRTETSPEDIEGIHASRGILTSRGGMTSHAAVVARGMGKACVCGATEVIIDRDHQSFKVGDVTVREGDEITIIGQTGEVHLGRIPTLEPELSDEFHVFMTWADRARRMKVRANAETPEDLSSALRFGAEGVGLCRTEHMFLEKKRLYAIRRLILARDIEDRRKCLEDLLTFQREDFIPLFKLMGPRPITVRLLDPPLHEFLPRKEEDIVKFSEESRLPLDELRDRIRDLHEVNPMLGHRGCRVAITFPEIYETQIEALLEAMLRVEHAEGVSVALEIMVPFIATEQEMLLLKASITRVTEKVYKELGQPLSFTLGTMIELPRAALLADKIAPHVDFFSFGTNDLTQTTMGLSRDDAATFFAKYNEKGIFKEDPFATLDQEGVGALIKMAVQKGRAVKPTLKLGICGEHGGDPKSIDFFESCGLDYVSCSPYRVPIARLAAAQAALRQGTKVVRVERSQQKSKQKRG